MSDYDYDNLILGIIIGAIVVTPIIYFIFNSSQTQTASVAQGRVYSYSHGHGQGQGHQNEEIREVERDSKGFIRKVVIHRKVTSI